MVIQSHTLRAIFYTCNKIVTCSTNVCEKEKNWENENSRYLSYVYSSWYMKFRYVFWEGGWGEQKKNSDMTSYRYVYYTRALYGKTRIMHAHTDNTVICTCIMYVQCTSLCWNWYERVTFSRNFNRFRNRISKTIVAMTTIFRLR